MVNGIGRSGVVSWASSLFSKLDTRNQGYIEQSDPQAAFGKISGSSSSADTANGDEVFSQLDGNSDGKVTKDELSASLQKIAEELDSQFDNMRMHGAMGGPGGMGGMPPPPPPGNVDGDDGAGFTKDEMTTQMDEIGASDDKRSTLISNLVNNFDAADTDGDGKISAKEAMAYDQATQSSSSENGSSARGSSSTTGAASGEEAVMMKIMQLMQAYGVPGDDANQSSRSTTMSTSA